MQVGFCLAQTSRKSRESQASPFATQITECYRFRFEVQRVSLKQ